MWVIKDRIGKITMFSMQISLFMPKNSESFINCLKHSSNNVINFKLSIILNYSLFLFRWQFHFNIKIGFNFMVTRAIPFLLRKLNNLPCAAETVYNHCYYYKSLIKRSYLRIILLIFVCILHRFVVFLSMLIKMLFHKHSFSN